MEDPGDAANIPGHDQTYKESSMQNTKTCKHCGQVVELQHFYKHAYNKDGLMNVCKPCHNKRCRVIEENTKDRRKAYRDKYYQANPEKYRKRSREYKAKNRDKVRETFQKWRKANPMQDRIRHHRRRARKQSVATFRVSGKEINYLKNQPCFYCGSKEKISIDHVVPLSRGGSNSIGNYAPACFRCNSSKKDKLITEWKKVRGW